MMISLHMNHHTEQVRIAQDGKTLTRVDNLESYGPWVVGYRDGKVVIILRRVPA
jgi:hypothetical protein